MRQVALINVKYSPNLGDGIIAECLESELRSKFPDWRVFSVDLAGRTSFGSGLDAGRGKVLRMLEWLPKTPRRWTAAAALKMLIALKYRKVWQAELSSIDAAIIGGGQLFADADLNFPLKISAVLDEVSANFAALAVFGVGVAPSFSEQGKQLIREALEDTPPAYVALRDEASRANWIEHFGAVVLQEPTLCRDPGLLASEVYPAASRDQEANGREIGIGIANPSVVQLHTSTSEDRTKGADQFWTDLCMDLLERGHHVTLFSNGPFDDEQYLDRIYSRIDHPNFHRAARARTPEELAKTIRRFDAIAAHRLHANIIAYSYRIPHVGLAWDPKLQSFFDSVGRSQFVADRLKVPHKSIADLIEKSISDGIDSEQHAQTLSETRDAIALLGNHLARVMDAEQTSAPSKVENAVRSRLAAQDIE